MRARPIAVLGGVFAAAALTSLFVVRQFPREGDVTPMSAAPAPPPAPASSPAVEPPATPADGVVQVRATAGGEPLVGAEVSLYLAQPGPEGEIAWFRAGAATTGKDGIARLPARPGRYLAAARAPGLAPGRAEVVRTRGEDASRVEVALAPVASLSGRITAGGGRPLPARVTLVPAASDAGAPAAPPEELATAAAGADGAFALAGLAPGVHALRVEAEGFHPALLPRVAVPRAAPIEVALERLGLLSGEVRRADGRPAAGAVVHAVRREHAAQAIAAADGRFSLALPAGEYQVLASDGSAAAAFPAPASVAPGAQVRGVTLALGTGAALEGEVVRAASGAPAAGARVEVSPHETGRALARAVAGPDGRFRVEGLAPGAWDVSAVQDGASPARESGLTLAAGDRLRVRLAQDALGAIEGEVRDAAGRPLAHVRVRTAARGDGLAAAAPLEARTDFDGRYRIEGVEAGRAEVVALEEGAALGDARPVHVQPGRASRADFALPAAGAVAGRASRAGRPPPLGTAVLAVPLRTGAGTLQVARTLADASGNYRLSLPAGEYRVYAAPVEAGPADLRVPPAFVRVEPGRTARLELAVADLAAAAGLEITVLEPGGAPSPGAVVTLARPEDGKIALAVSADEEGRVRLPGDLGLAGREVTVRARNGGRSGQVTRAFPASGGAIAVRLSPGAALDGLVRAGGRAVRGFTVEVASQPSPDGWRTLDVHRFAGDRFELGDLPAEPLRLSVRSDDGRRGAAELTPAAGTRGVVEIALDGAHPGR